MAKDDHRCHHLTLETPNDEDEDEDKELQDLEQQVKEMAQRILHLRTTIPDQFKKTLTSSLAAQRPVLLQLDEHAGSSPTVDPNLEAERVESRNAELLAEEDPKTAEKLRLLKLKISSNVSVMPILLKRMNECIATIDKLDSYDGKTHPAFKRKRTC